MTDKEIAASLRALVAETSFQGSAVKRVNEMVDWLEDIEEGRKVITEKEPLKEVTRNG